MSDIPRGLVCPLCRRTCTSRNDRLEHIVGDHEHGVIDLIERIEHYERMILDMG